MIDKRQFLSLIIEFAPMSSIVGIQGDIEANVISMFGELLKNTDMCSIGEINVDYSMVIENSEKRTRILDIIASDCQLEIYIVHLCVVYKNNLLFLSYDNFSMNFVHRGFFSNEIVDELSQHYSINILNE